MMTRNSHAARRAAAKREGFTLVELIVAILILSVGLLGMASTSAVVLRQMSGGAKQSIAAAVAQSRMEILRANRCGTATSGTATTRGLSESWTVTPLTRSDSVRVVVSWTARSGITRTNSYNSRIPCAGEAI